MQRFDIPLHLLSGFRFIGFNDRGKSGSRIASCCFFRAFTKNNHWPLLNRRHLGSRYL